MKIRVASASPEVAIIGLGIVQTNEWFEVTKEQESKFERLQGKSLNDATNIETKTSTKKGTKKEAS